MKHIKKLMNMLKDKNGKYSVNRIITAVALLAAAIAVSAISIYYVFPYVVVIGLLVWAVYPDRKAVPTQANFISRFSYIALVSLFRALQENRYKLGIIDAPRTFETMRKEFANFGDICRVRAWILKVDSSQFNDDKLEMIRIYLQETLRELVITGDVDITYTDYNPYTAGYDIITITEVKDGDGFVRIEAVFITNEQAYTYCHRKLYDSFQKSAADSSDDDF